MQYNNVIINNLQHNLRVDNQIYRQRRLALLNKLQNGIVIIPNSELLIRNQDAHYPYRFDSNFYYLTGFNEPNSVLVLDANTKQSILFCQGKDKGREIWEGISCDIEEAKDIYFVDLSFHINQFYDITAKLILDNNYSSIFYTFGVYTKYDNYVINMLQSAQKLSRRGITAPYSISDINQNIASMRLIKDDIEKQIITQSCNIAMLAHLTAMQSVKSLNFEYELEAKILAEFYKYGSRYPAYTSIVAGGQNACILHYVSNNAKLKQDDLLLIDAGCEYMGYASDITRTYPVSGKFTKEQQAIYEIVLAANKAAIQEVKVGNQCHQPNLFAINILTQGLIDLKLLTGNLHDNIHDGSYKQFYMHGIGHWMGLDVHDVGIYKQNNEYIKFVSGMCTTIEPGIYIRPDNKIPEKYWHIGVRIEDDIFITDNKVINLTANLPKEVSELEKIINL